MLPFVRFFISSFCDFFKASFAITTAPEIGVPGAALDAFCRDDGSRVVGDHCRIFSICNLSIAYRFVRRSRKAFVITETELNVIAALAMIGLSKIPKKG